MQRLEEDLGAVNVELTTDDLHEIESAASAITAQGAQYPEQLERLSYRSTDVKKLRVSSSAWMPLNITLHDSNFPSATVSFVAGSRGGAGDAPASLALSPSARGSRAPRSGCEIANEFA